MDLVAYLQGVNESISPVTHPFYPMKTPDYTYPPHAFKLNQREEQFIKLACSDLTYVQIADRMHVSPRTVDGYREVLFERFAVRSRVGLALWAVRAGIVTL
ncbi:MAG: helix-turn-helix transcriptional regulator [Bacteroidetes bacterium]|nr:helix-turn-helix transcriptional regulator [Fibrella sp.]